MRLQLYCLNIFALVATSLGGHCVSVEACNPAPAAPLKLAAEQSPIIPAPADPQQWREFREALAVWRDEVRRQIGYDASLYDRPDFQWVSSAFNCCFLMMYDQAFYDRERNRYTVERILAEGTDRFGRYDIVVLWHAYPRIGLDDRNQFDFYRDMPGGLEALRKVADTFHARGVKVYINYNPWDTGTRREGISDIDALCGIVEAIGADGIFLDTMERGSEEFRARLDRARPGVVLESELALPVGEIHSHHMSWAQWFYDAPVPGVLRNKWLERRHMQHGISRWTRDRSKELQTAWLNGSGIMIWENVFGQWMGWSPRDCHILKTMTGIQHRFAPLFASENWIPLVDGVVMPNVYAGLWYDDTCRLWTLANRSYVQVDGPILQVEDSAGWRYFDLVAGCEVHPDDRGILEGRLIPRGIGCIAAFRENAVPDDLETLLASQAAICRRATYDTSTPRPETSLRPVAPTHRYDRVPDAMVAVGPYEGEMPVVFNCREIGYYQSLEYDYVNIGPPTAHQQTTFTRKVDVEPFAIDLTPVTNAQYKAFLDATGYKPRCGVNFLKHWENGSIPSGLEDHPVVYVDLDDARAYAAWAGKRLPREEEWQLAAAGPRWSRYPWGDEMEPGRCNDRTDGRTTPVKAYPEGRAACGAYDMCSNTWELTESEYNDGRNRFCILKGGSCYRAEGSDWYFDGGAKTTDFAAKQLLLYPGIDRCATVGFRCVVDLKK